MTKGFFQSSKLAGKAAEPRIARCGLCGLSKHCISPKMPPTGKGKRKILVVAEAPGEREDKNNTQLIGRAGQRLRKTLKKLGVDLDRDCIKTNAVICRREGNETPTDDMIQACRPNLIKTIHKYQPNVIILLGAVAVKSLLSSIWKEDMGTISRWGGYCIPCHNPNAWIVPTFHPSYIMRRDDKVLNRIFKQHLKMAVRKSKSKPWKEVPSYKDEVEVIMNPSRAVREIKEMVHRGGMVSFDYETNCLKPDGKGIKIVSCSVCWKGKKTIAFPMHGSEMYNAIDIMLKSPMPKIASNLKFEDRWTRAIMGHPVKNWLWDTMIAAHVLDNRPSITGLKFQSFVWLGAESYDDHIKPFLKSVKGSKFNRIHEIDWKDLLLYNGLDSLLEYKVAMKQMKYFKSKLYGKKG